MRYRLYFSSALSCNCFRGLLRGAFVRAVLSIILLFGGVAPVAGQQYHIRQFSIEEGLAQAGVYSICQDRNGRLWFGTEGGGASQYDGKRFRTFHKEHGLSGDVVRVIFEDAEGRLWFGTQDGGVCWFDGKRFYHDELPAELQTAHVRAITQDNNGYLWFATFGDGIIRFNGFEHQAFTTADGLGHNTVRAVFADAEGTVWAGTDDGLSRYNGTNFDTYSPNDGMVHSKVLCITEDEHQHLWIGTNGGASRFDYAALKAGGQGFHNVTVTDGLINKRVKSIVQDHTGNLWFGTRAGASRITASDLEAGNMEFRSFTQAEGLSNSRIRTIFEDAAGTVWFGTYFGGACQYVDERFVHITTHDGLPEPSVTATLIAAKNELWLGTVGGGICVYKQGEKIAEYNLSHGLPDDHILCLLQTADERVWIGTAFAGIVIWDGNTFTSLDETSGMSDNQVNALHQDANGTVWAATGEGLTGFPADPAAAPIQWTEREGLAGQNIFTVASSQHGGLWLGTDAGLSHIALADGTVLNWGLADDYDWGEVVALAEDDAGHLWMGTREHGIGRFNGSDFKFFTEHDGLLSNRIKLLALDLDGVLWAGSARGLNRLELDFDQNVAAVTGYSHREGFFGIETNHNAVCADSIGRLWFGTIRGATRYDAREEQPNGTPPHTYFSSVKLFFSDSAWHPFADSVSPLGVPMSLVLPYDQNHLTFEYIGVDTRHPDQVQYLYQLEGHDKVWSPPTGKTEVVYSNLGPGTYQFKVMAGNSDGFWTSNPAVVKIKILPPFWQTWWFITICTLLGIVLAYAIISWRIRRLQRDKARLEALVDERTRDLRAEKEKSEALLLNILPKQTAEELKSKGYAETRDYASASILFSDFKGFTALAEKLTPNEVIQELNACFTGFDEAAGELGVEKIKTIGDAYMAAGGIPSQNTTHPVDTVLLGLKMTTIMAHLNKPKLAAGMPVWSIRLGVHTGPIIAGVVGKKKFAYDIWGDAVNTASRMESSGEPGRVNISSSTYDLVRDYFVCEHRGKVQAKGKGEVDMYFVNRIVPELSADTSGTQPNEAFYERLKTTALRTAG